MIRLLKEHTGKEPEFEERGCEDMDGGIKHEPHICPLLLFY